MSHINTREIPEVLELLYRRRQWEQRADDYRQMRLWQLATIIGLSLAIWAGLIWVGWWLIS